MKLKKQNCKLTIDKFEYILYNYIIDIERGTIMNTTTIGNTVLQFPSIRICQHCHGQVDDDARFCKHCGNKLDVGEKKRYAPKSKHTKVPLKTIEEIRSMEEILATPSSNTQSKKRIADRNKTLFMLGICTGLRASDLVRVTPSMIGTDGVLYIIEKKTGKGRSIIISENIKKVLDNYIEKYKIGNSDPLFPSQKGNDVMTVHSLNRLIVDAAKELGWNVALYGSHTLRKTYAYQFYTTANGISRERGYRALSVLCKELNHSSEAITLSYIGIDKEEVCEICNITSAQYNSILNSYIDDDEE